MWIIKQLQPIREHYLLKISTCDYDMDDYSEALWATSPDFESHPSGRWEPLQIACFAEYRLLDEVSLVKAANTPPDAARPWQDLPHQVHDNQAKSRWLYATGTLASNWPDSWLCRARIINRYLFYHENSWFALEKRVIQKRGKMKYRSCFPTFWIYGKGDYFEIW